MGKLGNKISIARIFVETATLILVVLLTKNNTLQLFFVLFLVGVVVSLFAGRLFCGWICPMNTLFRVIDVVDKKLKIKRFNPPKFLTNKIVRLLFLMLFISSLVLIKISGLHINMLLYIILFSILVTMFFKEEFWHRNLCPFGTILSFTSKKAGRTLKIDEEKCISCGKCQKVCPSQSISTLENNKRRNQSNECLLCFQCSDDCPEVICNYGR